MMKTPIYKVLYSGLAVIIFFVSVGVAGLVYLDTEGGRKQLTNFINENLTSPQSAIEISGIDGSLYSDVIIPSIVLSDRGGKWLEIKDTTINWSIAPLLNKRFSASDVSIDSIHLRRLPNTDSENIQDENETFKFPSLPIDIDIDITQYNVSTINIDENVATIPSAFKLDGTLKLTQNDGINTEANLISTEGHNDRVHFNISYPRDGSNLDTALDINIPENGLFATLAGLDISGGLTLILDGHGPLNNWAGSFAVQKNDKPISNASITRIDETLSINAPIDLSNLLTGDLTALTGKSNHLKVEISPSEVSKNSNLNMVVTGDFIDLSVDGALSFSDLTKSNHLDVSINVKDSTPFNSIIAPQYFKPFTFTGTLTNIFSKPQITVNYQNLKAGTSNEIEASFNGQIEAALNQQVITIRADGKITKISGSAVANIKPLLKEGVNWSLDTTIADQYSAITASDLSIEADFIRLDGRGEFNSDNGVLNASITTNLDNISKIDADLGLNQGLSGKATVETIISRNNATDPLNVSANLITENINLGNEILNEVVGFSPSFTTNLVQTADGEIVIDNTALTGDYLSFDLAGNISSEKIINNTSFNLSLSNIHNLKKFDSTALSGNIELTGLIAGDIASPSIDVKTGFNQLNIQSMELNNFAAHIIADNVLNELTGAISITSETNFGPLSANTSIQKIENKYAVTDTKISLGRYLATGNFNIPSGSPVTGGFALITNDIENNAAGMTGTITVNVDLIDENNDQKIIIESALEEISFPISNTELLGLKSGLLSGDMLLNDGNPQITMTAALKELSHPKIHAKEANLKVEQIESGFRYALDALGNEKKPYQLELAGDFLTANEKSVITLDVLGSIVEVPIKTASTARVTLHNGDIMVAPFVLQLGEGKFSGNLEKNSSGINANLTSNDADLTPISVLIDDLPIAGLLNGEVNLKTTSDALLSDYNLTLSNIALLNNDTDVDDNILELNITGVVTEENAQLAGVLAANNLFNAQFNAGLPITIDPITFATDLPQSTPIDGNISWKGRVEPLWPILQLIDHDLRGDLDISMQLDGTISAPNLNGNIVMSDGRYENMQTGFVANNIDMDANIKDRRITLDNFKANDGEEGLISATADINLAPDFNYDAMVNLNLSNTKLVRQSELAIMASSKLAFEKNSDRTSLVGDITVENAEIGAIEQGGPAITKLDVIEINGEGIINKKPQRNGALGPIDLDLKFIVPGKLFIRSFGLDSEWEADLEIDGTSEKPIVSGTSSLIRGFFEFSGKRFNLTRGNFSFPGDQTNDPIIEIAAEHQLTDMIANLRIYGQASNPKLEMSSTPYLPENEVLARILFGTSVAELTAVEAVQLASAVHSLSNGGGQGLLGGIRRAIGVDRLSIDNDASREYGTTITGGKYLTDNVYVEVSTAPATGETATSVEVGLTRNLSLVTRRTLDHDNNLSIRWFWDY